MSLLLIDDPERFRPKANHNLNSLWASARKLVREVDPTFPKGHHKKIDAVIKELISIDNSSTAFRYDRTLDGKASLEGIERINTRRFGDKMKAACKELDCMDSHIAYQLMLHEEMMSDWRYQTD